MNELTRNIETWAQEKSLLTADPIKQFAKLIEEVGELAEGLNKGKVDLAIDGIGDCYVVLTILARQIGTSIDECVLFAYNEIKDRKGKTINGVFVKENDLT